MINEAKQAIIASGFDPRKFRGRKANAQIISGFRFSGLSESDLNGQAGADLTASSQFDEGFGRLNPLTAESIQRELKEPESLEFSKDGGLFTRLDMASFSGVLDKSKILEDTGGYYTAYENIYHPKSSGGLGGLVDGLKPIGILAAFAGGMGALTGALASVGAGQAVSGAVDYSLAANGVPSLSGVHIGAGESLSFYGNSTTNALGSISSGGTLSGAALEGSGAWLPSAGDAVTNLKSMAQTASTAKQIASIVSAPIGSTILQGKQPMTYTIPLSQNLSGENSPMTSGTTPALGGISSPSPLSGSNLSNTTLIVIGLAVVAFLWAAQKGGKK